MAQPYDLTQLDSHSFEHLVNFLSLKTLGNGVTGFAAGADGGKDGYLRGRAPYPTDLDSWEGIWFLQSKFHKPHLSSDSQKWLIKEVAKEITQFKTGNRKLRPNNWIIASNIEPSGVPETGAFDKIKEMVNEFDPDINVDIWGGRKILDLLAHHPEAVAYYGHFLTPGHVITELYNHLNQHKKNIKDIIDHLIVNQFHEFSYTKLEQAGSGSDQRPKIYELFRDLPIHAQNDEIYFILKSLVSAANNVQRNSTWNNFGHGWQEWSKNPIRARIILLKGGPGQGKSTAGQYFGQLQRAAFILSDDGPRVTPQIKEIANELKRQAMDEGFWPSVPRIPLFVELKDFANWYSLKSEGEPRNIVAYICDKVKIKTSKNVTAEMLHDSFSLSSWFINFDGLDEVPNDLKDNVANEIIIFANELIPQLDADFLILCTTRPQGYSGQFENLFSSTVTLTPLPPDIALACASAVVKYNRTEQEYEESINILKYAMESDQVKELMTTPLQSHIMAVVVRDGGRPPEKRWELFKNFYSVMKKRESQKNFPDVRISALLRERDQLLKTIHDRLGICLHTKSEISKGAEATFDKSEFKQLAIQTTAMQIDGDTDEVVDTLMEATTERLVFVNTPESSDSVRFDIRQLQEFFAAEFIYNAVSNTELRNRLEIICGDAHWREVVHFLLSALAHNTILSELSVAVNLLQQLDDDGENYRVKTFKKRMGTGSLLTLRLIEEGVLEQDKRIRFQFNNALTPLWSNIERDILSRITSIKKEQSRSWVINNMIEAFIDLDYSEHITVGYLLAIMLPIEHPRIEEVLKRYLQAPEYYFNAIFELDIIDAFGSHRRKNAIRNCYQPWFIEFITSTISSTSVLSNTIQCDMLNFAVKHFQKELLLKSNYNIPKETIEILEFLNIEEKKDTGSIDTTDNLDEIYCFVSPKTHDINWKTAHAQDGEIIPKLHISDDISSKPLNLIKSALKFHYNKNIVNYKLFLDEVKKSDYNTDIIPSQLKAMIPLNFDCDDLKKHIDCLEHMENEEINSIIHNGCFEDIKIIPSFQYIKITDSAFNKKGWANFCKDYPALALNVWSGPFIDEEALEKIKIEHKFEFFGPILEISKNHAESFSAYFFLWQELFDVYPEQESELRSMLIKCSPTTTRMGFNNFKKHNSFIKINIATEKEFIVHFAHALLIGRVSNIIRHDSNYRPISTNYNEELLSKMGIPSASLVEIIKDKNEDNTIRTASLCCYIAQTSPSKNDFITNFFDEKYDEIFLSLLVTENQDLLINALYTFLFDISTYDIRLMNFLGNVSILTKEDYTARLILQNIYQRWRERSFAPVNKSQALQSWLDYSY
ncbi:NACHT domain-containing protein [Lelliottia nimipressuralis]|uniref:ATP-binding protein n=1 Tax=Lelliottia nimipressuralis TaxID=69220 RepID=A0ABY3P6T8_9ENTR|nr:hypothetical protein [Lelliottia nimipressuralis]RXJ21490.1 hypothetical protein ETG88_03675 [Lelliottia nimipressuralis]TYT34920.1 hypothetical protein FZO59_04600 [Lelliottia nimipressuralis]